MTAPRDPDDEAAAAWRRTVDAGYSDEVERFYESGGAALDDSHREPLLEAATKLERALSAAPARTRAT